MPRSQKELFFDALYSTGKLFTDLNNLEKVEELYLRTLVGLSELGYEKSIILDIEFNLGNAYLTQGKLELADKMFLQALGGDEMTPGSEPSFFGDIMESMSSIRLRQTELDEAAEMRFYVVEEVLKETGTSPIRKADALFRFGKVFHKQNLLEQAEALYNHALDGYKFMVSLQHASTLTAAITLASLHRDQSRPVAVATTC